MDLPKNAFRTLIVIHKLAKGMVGYPVLEEDIEKEITNKRIYDMTDEEFSAYHKQVLAEIKLNQN